MPPLFLEWRYALTENIPPQFPYRNASTFFSGGMSPLEKCGGIEILMEF